MKALALVRVRYMQFFSERPEDLAERLRPFGWIETEVNDKKAGFAILVPVDRGIVQGRRFTNVRAFAAEVGGKLGIVPGTIVTSSDPVMVRRTW